MTKVILTSDTHGCQFQAPPGDLLIHAGDLTTHGTEAEVRRALSWLQEWATANEGDVIFIAGNHDRWLQTTEGHALAEDWDSHPNVLYLRDRKIDYWGLRIYGSPWTPPHQDFAFMKTEEELWKVYADVPGGLDILITHGPAKGCLDMTIKGEFCGSPALRRTIDLALPKVHVFGHIHEAYGEDHIRSTRELNVSYVALDKNGPKPANPPVVLDF